MGIVKLRREASKWVESRVYTLYSKWIDRVEDARPGDWVEIYSWRDELLGYGFYEGTGAVGLRVLSWSDEFSDPEVIFNVKILEAFKRRERIIRWGFYRLVNADGDGIPGLIIDVYNDIAVIQSSSIGIDRYLEEIGKILLKNGIVSRVYVKNDHRGRREAGLPSYKAWLYGEGDTTTIINEGDVRFQVNVEKGQKTGFFIDHRINRMNIEEFAFGRVLDLFSYTGGFAIHLLNSGAEHALLVDEDSYAISEARNNLIMNELLDKADLVNGRVEYILEELIRKGEKFDLIIVDPPALIQSRELYERGLAKYKSIYSSVFNLVRSGGFIFASSCSYFLGREEFKNLLIEVARENNSQIRFVGSYWGISPDHIYRPVDRELDYLKCYLLEVERY